MNQSSACPSTPLTALKGVGPARARALERLGLSSVRDLLFFVPRGLEQHGARISASAAAQALGEEVSVAGRMRAPRLFRRGGRASVLSATLEDGSGSIGVLYFNQPWLLERLRASAASGETLELYGRVVATKRGPALASPEIARAERPLPAPGTLVPIYPLTEGLGQQTLRRLVRLALEGCAGFLVDRLSAEELAELDLPPLQEAVRELHRPPSLERFERARRRIAFEHLLALQARLERSRAEQARGRARALRVGAEERATFLRSIPFAPTPGQARVIEEIASDLCRERPMRRLLQGDVGSGKTLVGLFALYAVARAGGQAALFAPTEILAEQHQLGLKPWLERLGLESVLLTGSLAPHKRRRALQALGEGTARVAIGTHALISAEVRFAQLDLVVIDEQQRFGVAQKQALLDKGRDVHVLLLTATPIPRTLALCLYGDLDTSVLDDKPLQRGRVETRVVGAGQESGVLECLSASLERGERAFWICPRILETEGGEEEARAAEAVHASLGRGALARFGIELIHGRIPAAERAERIERFRRGITRLLVATSMVEVGIDVPEATVMVIEGAERFGLAQLHQLRGRVGRGALDARCFLLTARAAAERLLFLERTEDGFAIAEEDLRRRGMGDLAGARQAGANVEGLELPWIDLELVLGARRIVRERADLARTVLEQEGERSVAIV